MTAVSVGIIDPNNGTHSGGAIRHDGNGFRPGNGTMQLSVGEVVLVGDPLVVVGAVVPVVLVPVLVGAVVVVLVLLVVGEVVAVGVVVVEDGGGDVVVGPPPPPPPPVTVIVPVIEGWNRQWKLNVPACVKVNENVAPGPRSGEFQRPSSLVELCTVPSVSLFTQVTVSPTAMVSWFGLYWTCWMLIVWFAADAVGAASITSADSIPTASRPAP